MIADRAGGRALLARARVVSVLAAVLALAACVLSAAPASAVTPPHGYDTAATAYDPVAYNYDARALLLSPDSAAAGARGSPSRPGAVSWVSPVTLGGVAVAANTAATLSRPSSRVLGANLEAAGAVRPAGSAAHHIAAGSSARAAEARAVLQRYGIDVNDAGNGVFLPGRMTSPNPTGAAVHSRIHTNAYYAEVNRPGEVGGS